MATMPIMLSSLRFTPRLSLMALALGCIALAGCESERDRKLEERIAAAEAKAAAAEKRAAAAETAAGSTSPVTVGEVDDSADSDSQDSSSNDQSADGDVDQQQQSDNDTAFDAALDNSGLELVIQPPPPVGIPGPVDVGSVPVAT